MQLIGAGGIVALDPRYVVQAQEFDSGRGGAGTALKLAEVLAQLTGEE
ncbi:MAG: hypothetical protein ACXW5U_00960 [Thermoanaerobaculia bacterium]